jgi:hypothetical protein
METIVGLAFDCLNGKRDGFTVDKDLNTPVQGFMVAGYQGNEYQVRTPAHARQVIEMLYPRLRMRQEFIGGWMHEGVLYLEPSFNLHTEQGARHFAEANDQIAIWDVEAGKEIRLK